MSPSNAPPEACPRCKSAGSVKPKMLLVERGDPTCADDDRRSGNSDLAFSVTDLKPEFAVPGFAGQFIQGLYCERCGIGFVPESMAKRPRPRYALVAGGWQRVHEDGTRGPLLNRIADDPDHETSEVRPLTASAGAPLDSVEVGRAGSRLDERHGLRAYIVAAEMAQRANADGDLEAAQFWAAVSSSIQPR